MTVKAIFENGVFRPTETIVLPEHTVVNLEYEKASGVQEVNLSPVGMEEIYAILSERFDGGDPEISAKHNEHQP